MIFQQGFPADTVWDHAAAAIVKNAQRHHPHATVGQPVVVESASHAANGEMLVEVALSGDLSTVDLSDPDVVRLTQIERASAVLAGLPPDAVDEVVAVHRSGVLGGG